MEERITLKELREILDEHVENWHNGNNDDVLSIETIETVRIWLTLGGPNIFIDVQFTKHKNCIGGRLHYAWGSESMDYPLTQEEAEEIADLFYVID